MTRMAQAWDNDNAVMVDVISVYDGDYVVANQWTGETRKVESLSELSGLWVNTDIIDTFDEFVTHFGIADSYFMVAAIVRNSAWAQAIAIQWAGLY